MGLTTPLQTLETTLSDFDTRYLRQSTDTSPEAEETLCDDILRTAFLARDLVSRLGEIRPLPDMVVVARDAYDDASWSCVPDAPYGGDNHNALVNAAMGFLTSLTELSEIDSD